jgi:hypothetical protein
MTYGSTTRSLGALGSATSTAVTAVTVKSAPVGMYTECGLPANTFARPPTFSNRCPATSNVARPPRRTARISRSPDEPVYVAPGSSRSSVKSSTEHGLNGRVLRPSSAGMVQW